MKKLIIARHGEYDERRRLSESGAGQMRRLAERLRPIVGSARAIVLASTAKRASMSGTIVAETLGCPAEEHEVLWSEDRHPPELGGALELIRLKGAEVDVVVVVTHIEYTGELPPHIGKHLFGGVCFDYREVPKGEAWLVDFDARTCVRVP